ncbi:hypothetical protein JYB87_05995 [Shewanella avicenniae]|uniref:Uncharacterized protein n=1 Tax=Shewanella avicenniae TaxID=2814294 RepID=A0ABX7QTM6_9GAMM|nr:hypothetical protein [Shewanella avicenniae]QSX34779.1 hypothetical protein JYB87_05995 [Shewanella avicenniae]
MGRLLFVPIILCLLWIAFLRFYGIPLAKGKQGFIWIIGISSLLILLLAIALWLTQ